MSHCEICGWYGGGHTDACQATRVRIAQLERDLAAAQAKIAGNAELIGKFVKAAADAEAEAAALRVDAERWQYMEANREVALLTTFFGNGCINKTLADVRAAIDQARKEGA